MSDRILNSRNQLNNLLTKEQLEQVMEAILAGKYSWACFLMLRFVGYDPLQYLPYRTCNRLIKENRQVCQPSKHRTRIEDLDYLEEGNSLCATAKGGFTYLDFDDSFFIT
jgi:hypothetical protein